MKPNTFLFDKRVMNQPEVASGGNGAESTEPPVEAPVDAQTAEAPAEPAEAPDFSFLGDDFVTDGAVNTEAFKARWEDMLAEETRRGEIDIPEDGNYDLAIPDDMDFSEIGLPEGVTIAPLDPEDPDFAPVFEEAKAFLHENGIGQTAAKGLMGLVAKIEAAKEAKRHTAAAAQYETLGATEAARSARMASIKRAAENRLPADQAAALLSDLTTSPKAVAALESLLVKNAGPKAAQSTTQKVDPNLRGYDLLKAANEMTLKA